MGFPDGGVCLRLGTDLVYQRAGARHTSPLVARCPRGQAAGICCVVTASWIPEALAAGGQSPATSLSRPPSQVPVTPAFLLSTDSLMVLLAEGLCPVTPGAPWGQFPHLLCPPRTPAPGPGPGLLPTKRLVG